MTAVATSSAASTRKVIRVGEHAEILRRYATAGTDIADIAKALSLQSDYVSGVISTLAAFNRQYARTLVQEYERNHPGGTSAAPPTKPTFTPPRPVGNPADAADPDTQPVKPAAPVKQAEPAREPTTLRAQVLIDRAATSGDRRLEKLAEQAQALIEEIEERLDKVTAERAAADKVARLEADLAAARAELAKHRPATAKPRRSGPSPADIRAWCRANNVDVNDHGRINQPAVDAYTAAHEGGTS